MTPQKVITLAIAAVAAVGGGIWLAGRQASTPAEQSALLYPDFKKELAAVTTIRIAKAGATTVELKHGDTGWTVSERANYPADDAKLRKLIGNLADAKVLEEKTSSPESYAKLGVEDAGTQIEIDGPKSPLKLIVGKQATGGQSHYVRRAGEPKSWLIDKSIDTSSSPDQWLSKNIIDVSADRVQSAEVSISGAKPYSAAKKSRADADFTVDSLPKGKQLSSPSAADSFAGALDDLTLADVRQASAMSGEPAARAVIKTFDGLVAEATGWKNGDKHYIALKTSYDPALAAQFKVATAEPKKKADVGTDGEGAPPAAEKAPAAAAEKTSVEPAKAATPNVEEQAGKSNAQLNGWVYEIPAYKYDAIFKPIDELLKK